jgi:hypothetical protein
LAHQDFVRHLGEALILAHGAPLLAETFHLGSCITLTGFSRPNGS